MSNILISTPPTSLATGLLQLDGGVAISSTPVYVADQTNTDSSLAISTNNIGIGTTSAFKKLSIRTSTSTEAMEVRATTGNTGIRFSIADSSVTTDNYNKGAIYFLNTGLSSAVGTMAFAINNLVDNSNVTTAYERMRLTPSGSLLIGTTTESARLFVKGSGSTSATTTFLVQNSSASNSILTTDDGKSLLTANISNDAPLVVNNAYGWTGSYVARCQTWLSAGSEVARMMANGSMILNQNITATTFKATQNIPSDVSFGGNGSGNGMYMPASNVTAIATSSTERLRVTSAGSLLIGTTTDSARLFVKGSGSTSATTSFLIQDSAGVQLFNVRDDDYIQFGAGALTNYNDNTGVFNIWDARPNYCKVTQDAFVSTDVRVGKGAGSIASNTTLGYLSLNSNVTGSANTAVGNQALRNSTSSNNTAVGNQALFSTTTGGSNTSMGAGALRNTTNGEFNTAVGDTCLNANISGTENVGVGASALANSTASRNVAIGMNAMLSNTSGERNVAVGYATNSGNFSNSVMLGYGATATGSNQMVFGSASGTVGTVVAGANASTQYWNVKINGTDYKILLA